MVPSGICRVRLPWRNRCNNLSTVRAAAGVPSGMEKVRMAASALLWVEVFMGVPGQRVVKVVGGVGLRKKGTFLIKSLIACQWMRSTTPSVMAG